MNTTYININGDVRDMSSLTVPQDRTFRDAWEFNGDVVEVDMAAALAIHKDNLRRERKPMMEDLDTEFMMALETGGDTTAIVAKKVALRDITEHSKLAKAATPRALKALTIEALLK